MGPFMKSICDRDLISVFTLQSMFIWSWVDDQTDLFNRKYKRTRFERGTVSFADCSFKMNEPG